MVTESDRLGGLQVSKTGHDGVGFCLRQRQQTPLQSFQFSKNSIDGVSGIKADVGNDLIIA